MLVTIGMPLKAKYLLRRSIAQFAPERFKLATAAAGLPAKSLPEAIAEKTRSKTAVKAPFGAAK